MVGANDAAAPDTTRWSVRDVQGRGSSAEKGLAAVHAMTLMRPDGSECSVGRLVTGARPVSLEVIATAQPMRFERCPICLKPNPNSREHVPPAAIGGSAVTATCHRCNNQFGSAFEAPLIDWWEDAVGSVSFRHESLPGARRTARLLARRTDHGEPVLLLDAVRTDPAIGQMMRSGGIVEMTFVPPDSNRLRIAAMKSAYLGACLLLRSIPETLEAVAIRSELVAARDVPRGARIAVSPKCSSLQIAKAAGPAILGEISLVKVGMADGEEPAFAISLARTLLVTWPLGGDPEEVRGHRGVPTSVPPQDEGV